MKKGLFLYGKEYLNSNKISSGIDKKVFNQLLALNNNDIDCKQICFPPEKENLFYKIITRLPFVNAGPKFLFNERYKNIDFLYFRRTNFFSIYCILMLKKIKRKNPTIKIIVEIPTYPYDMEISSRIIDYPFLIKDRINRKSLHKYVDRFVSVEDSPEIFGIKSIKVINGLAVETITPKEYSNKGNAINIIMVAMYADWHGVDRLLSGLAHYYQNGGERDIVLHLVGTGRDSLIDKFKLITQNNKIESHVILYGYMYGKQLDEVYNLCDIAVDSLGCHRKNIYLLSDLKSREYLAKGLPIVGSCKIDVLEEDYPYYLRFPSDDTDIDMNQIVRFYEDTYGRVNHEDVVTNIRNYAIKHVDISNTMKPIISFILD